MKFSDFKVDPSWAEDKLTTQQNFYKEIWEDNEYFRQGLDVNENDVVVDCGAGIGIFALLAAKKKAKKIISFESNANDYKYLVENCKKNKKITTVNAFVNHRSINVAGDNLPKEQVDLEAILDKYKLKTIDFLKMDIEGEELEVLQDLERSQIFFDYLIVEIDAVSLISFANLYERIQKIRQFRKIASELERKGFSICKVEGYNFHWIRNF